MTAFTYLCSCTISEPFLSPLQPKCDGQVLLTQVWKRLNLIECDYFGLEFKNVQSYWVCAFHLPLETGSDCVVE